MSWTHNPDNRMLNERGGLSELGKILIANGGTNHQILRSNRMGGVGQAKRRETPPQSRTDKREPKKYSTSGGF